MKKLIPISLIVAFLFSNSTFAGELTDLRFFNNENNKTLFSGDDYTDINFLNSPGKRRNSMLDCFGPGKKIITLGYGMMNINRIMILGQAMANLETEGLAAATVEGFGTIHGGFEYGLSHKFGVGATFNFSSYDASAYMLLPDPDDIMNVKQYKHGYKGMSIAINARFSYHFVKNENLDVYSAAGVGFNLSTYEYYNEYPDEELVKNMTVIEPYLLPISFETVAGVRYYFHDILGAYAELGYSTTIAQFGLTAKL